jgi:regulator of protease activity HflC (stomatin/prohibitin superfamily)
MVITDAAATHHSNLRSSGERPARTFNGYVMLLALLVGIAAFVLGATQIAENRAVGVPLMIIGALASTFVSLGFYLLQPNQAAAILLFGSYQGTDRTAGLRWRWPWLTRTKIATRVRNVTSERLKVNDLRGNPIEIASNVVWRVTDTAQALYDVDDYNKVPVRADRERRAPIGARYAYDDIEHQETRCARTATSSARNCAANCRSVSRWRGSRSTSVA